MGAIRWGLLGVGTFNILFTFIEYCATWNRATCLAWHQTSESVKGVKQKVPDLLTWCSIWHVFNPESSQSTYKNLNPDEKDSGGCGHFHRFILQKHEILTYCNSTHRHLFWMLFWIHLYGSASKRISLSFLAKEMKSGILDMKQRLYIIYYISAWVIL